MLALDPAATNTRLCLLATSTLCLFLQENPLVERAGGQFASRECGHGRHRLHWSIFNGAPPAGPTAVGGTAKSWSLK